MEIAVVSPESIRIKGKQASVIINPRDKDLNANYQAAILFGSTARQVNSSSSVVEISGPGDYEAGGIKISGVRYEKTTCFDFTVDGVTVMLVDNATLAKFHQKIHDYDIVIVSVNSDDDISSATNIANSVVLYTGAKAEEALQKAKETVEKTNKYVITRDKLPSEVVQMLLI